MQQALSAATATVGAASRATLDGVKPGFSFTGSRSGAGADSVSGNFARAGV